jgi:chorismate dehydratase
MDASTLTAKTKSAARILQIGSVSYLNAKPLIFGLESQRDLNLQLEVPSRLLAGLESSRFDAALLPSIDYQRLGNLRIVPAGGIGCDGPTLTVRVFSTRPINQITTLACDTDSHTSVALARIILAESYGIHPRIVDLNHDAETIGAARLLIGDKVVCEEPVGMDYQLDLGSAWKTLTGMPFVFAVWTARAGVDLGDLPARLEQAKQAGMQNLSEIISRHAIPRGWPAGMALQYMTAYLKYDVGPKQLDAIRQFHRLAKKYDLIGELKPLEIYSG